MADTTEDAFIGRVVANRYRLVRCVGRGGMGAVYEGFHAHTDKRVAVKILASHLSKDLKLIARFRREAMAASRLDHENCVTVYDFGEDADGTFYIAMEFVDGVGLGTEIRKGGPMPQARVARIGVQLLSALDSAHASGILHRDLKPQNIMLTRVAGRSDVIKVVDFGIAKFISNTKEDQVALTVPGTIFGTPEYMSPEQARGEELDARSDVYSAAVVLWHLLLGRSPFKGKTVRETLVKVFGEDPPSARAERPAAGIDASFERALLGALRKRREKRVRDASTFLGQLRPFDVEYALIDPTPQSAPTPGINPDGTAPETIAGEDSDPRLRALGRPTQIGHIGGSSQVGPSLDDLPPESSSDFENDPTQARHSYEVGKPAPGAPGMATMEDPNKSIDPSFDEQSLSKPLAAPPVASLPRMPNVSATAATAMAKAKHTPEVAATVVSSGKKDDSEVETVLKPRAGSRPPTDNFNASSPTEDAFHSPSDADLRIAAQATVVRPSQRADPASMQGPGLGSEEATIQGRGQVGRPVDSAIGSEIKTETGDVDPRGSREGPDTGTGLTDVRSGELDDDDDFSSISTFGSGAKTLGLVAGALIFVGLIIGVTWKLAQGTDAGQKDPLADIDIRAKPPAGYQPQLELYEKAMKLGAAAKSEEHLDLAREQYEQAAKANLDEAAAHIALITVYLELGELDFAAAHVKRLEEIDENRYRAQIEIQRKIIDLARKAKATAPEEPGG